MIHWNDFEDWLLHDIPDWVVVLVIATLLALLFCGCATTDTVPRQQQVVSGVTTTETKTPILQPCIFTDEIPPLPKLWMDTTQTKEKRRLASVIDIIELDAYVIAADSKLRGCAKPREVSK